MSASKAAAFATSAPAKVLRWFSCTLSERNSICSGRSCLSFRKRLCPKQRRNLFRHFGALSADAKIGPEEFAERGRILGVPTGRSELAGQTTQRIVDEGDDSFRNVRVIAS